MVHDNNKSGEFAGNFVQELQTPEGMLTPEFQAFYNSFAQRILWMDGNLCPGAFQMNTAWYKSVPERDPVFPEHEHPYAEIVGFFGSNPDDPNDLGAVIEFALNGEMHKITKSTMIYCPADSKHGPVRILSVDRPVFHFSVVMNAEYAEAKDVYK
ncbi:MAG: hypothetical protein FWB75_05020 [Oscillospiraceae bacterium]|nr:hypothetical protein [Oscillospiraceae bacterium]